MSRVQQVGKPTLALEITAGLAGRRFGLCGFDAGEIQRFSTALAGTRSLVLAFDERLLAQSAQVCDAMVIRLSGLSSEALRVAAASSTPVLLTGPSEAFLEGVGAAYSWPRDFMNEPWPDAELLVRLFRLLGSTAGSRVTATRQSPVQPVVLLADDDLELIALVAATLRNDGILCRAANDGLTALRMAREIVPDLIMLDVKMPGMDGFQVLETVRRDPRLETLPVILLTGCDDPTDVERGSELQADGYLGKPVSPNVLLNRVKRLLASHTRNDRRWVRALTRSGGPNGTASKRWMVVTASYTGTGGQA